MSIIIHFISTDVAGTPGRVTATRPLNADEAAQFLAIIPDVGFTLLRQTYTIHRP